MAQSEDEYFYSQTETMSQAPSENTSLTSARFGLKKLHSARLKQRSRRVSGASRTSRSRPSDSYPHKQKSTLDGRNTEKPQSEERDKQADTT
mmetsp:Transcript_20380/g.22638  ORF Transcript_20380/g.22638 Transcript_20380/m.22638 type:complete len:92 (-) Transcript_20380:356-631(-)